MLARNVLSTRRDCQITGLKFQDAKVDKENGFSSPNGESGATPLGGFRI
jgi:hypothetical protein